MNYPTTQDFQNIAKDAFNASPNNKKLSASKLTEAGSDLNLVVNAGVGMADEVTRQLKLAMQAIEISTATGADLDTLAFDRYKLTRKAQSYASVLLTFSRPGSSGGSGTIEAGSQISTSTGVVFALIYDVVFGATDLTQNGYALAVVSGIGANGLLPGTVITPLTALFDGTITVTNPYITAGGSNIESDDQFRSRIQNFYLTQQRGTLAALEQGALSVPGVYNAYAYDIIDPETDEPSGSAGLIISDQNGNSTAIMVSNVVQALYNYRSAGIYVAVIGGIVSLVSITIHVSYMSGIDTIAAQQAVRNAIVSVVNNLGGGQALYLSSIISAAASVSGVVVANNAITVPAGDIVPSTGQVLRTNGGLVIFI